MSLPGLIGILATLGLLIWLSRVARPRAVSGSPACRKNGARSR
jgi:hypothetical protein